MTIKYLGESAMSHSRLYQLEIGVMESETMGRAIGTELAKLVAEHLAAEYLERHGSEVLAALNPEAIANMAIAEAGAAVADTLKHKHAERIVTVPVPGQREVYQRGIFGGLRKL